MSPTVSTASECCALGVRRGPQSLWIPGKTPHLALTHPSSHSQSPLTTCFESLRVHLTTSCVSQMELPVQEICTQVVPLVSSFSITSRGGRGGSGMGRRQCNCSRNLHRSCNARRALKLSWSFRVAVSEVGQGDRYSDSARTGHSGAGVPGMGVMLSKGALFIHGQLLQEGSPKSCQHQLPSGWDMNTSVLERGLGI